MSISKKVLLYYDQHKKDLPWRKNPTAYEIWISEVMCQQTRVATVIPYYERFLQRLPDLQALAEISEGELMKLWEGLGYYRRARLLQQGAREMLARGGIPRTRKELLAISGIGEYTASAIASMAFGEKTPAVDGNLLRIVTRLTRDFGDIGKVATRRRVYDWSEKKMKERPGDFNQGMMEIGQEICLPKNPRCEICPLAEDCEAHRLGEEEKFPVKAPKKARLIEEKTVLLIEREGMVLLEKRTGPLLGGLYGFPMLEGKRSAEEVYAILRDHGLGMAKIERGPRSRHVFTHLEWHMSSYHIRLWSDPFLIKEIDEDQAENYLWKLREEMGSVALPRAFHAQLKKIAPSE